jgi:hypothetical protein
MVGGFTRNPQWTDEAIAMPSTLATRSAPSSKTSTIAADYIRHWRIDRPPSSKQTCSRPATPGCCRCNQSLVSCLTEGVQSKGALRVVRPRAKPRGFRAIGASAALLDPWVCGARLGARGRPAAPAPSHSRALGRTPCFGGGILRRDAGGCFGSSRQAGTSSIPTRVRS